MYKYLNFKKYIYIYMYIYIYIISYYTHHMWIGVLQPSSRLQTLFVQILHQAPGVRHGSRRWTSGERAMAGTGDRGTGDCGAEIIAPWAALKALKIYQWPSPIHLGSYIYIYISLHLCNSWHFYSLPYFGCHLLSIIIDYHCQYLLVWSVKWWLGS